MPTHISFRRLWVVFWALLGLLTATFLCLYLLYPSGRSPQAQDVSVWLSVQTALLAVAMLVCAIFGGLLLHELKSGRRRHKAVEAVARDLRQAHSQAEEANRGKSVFLANMSHEIRTPFQGLLGMLTLLDETPLSVQQRDYVKTARDSAQHLLGILNDILDVSTMESGTLKLAVVPTRLRDLLHDVENLMRVPAEQKGLSLTVYLAADVPSWVEADPTRLRQILFNLLNNAIKFTDHGGVMLEVMLPGGSDTGLLILVRDSGIGMDPPTLEGLFSRFHQADASVRRRYGGTGLGLEISRSLARLMGGDITVQSERGVGSTFTVFLPLRPAQPPAVAGPAAVSAMPAMGILVAEDHPINRKYLEVLLTRMGHTVQFCENGRQVLDLLRTRHFDVILMDLHMPELDGLSATRAIRAMGGTEAATKIVLVTADVVNDTRQKALQAGVDEFAPKPLQANDLRRVLERCAQSLAEPAASHEVFPTSVYEAPVVLPAAQNDGEWVDVATFREVSAMMPSETLGELLHALFLSEDGAAQRALRVLYSDDRQAIGHAVHQLKGTCMLLGCKAVVKTAARIEQLALQSQEVLPAELRRQLQQDVQQTIQRLQAMGVLPHGEGSQQMPI